MDSLQHKILKTSRDFTYSYYISDPTGSKPTLLLQHGFPDDAHLWSAIVPKLTQYRLVIPDLLGYSGTSKPTDPAAYSYAGIAQDLLEILDAEGIDKVISVGHDFGSVVAQRLYIHHPDRVQGLIILNVGYLLPQPPSDLEKTNDYLLKVFGYRAIAYQEFFLSDEAPGLLMAHLDRFYQALHGAPVDWTKDIFCARGSLRNWLVDEKREVELLDYAQDPEHRRRFMDRFQRDGFEAPLCYYKATNSNVQYDTVKDLEKDSLIMRVPVFYIMCSQDPLCREELLAPAKQGGFLPDLEQATIDSRHWCPYEKPDEVAGLMLSFLQRRFPS